MPSRSRLCSLLAALALGSFAGACGSSLEEYRCVSNADCENGAQRGVCEADSLCSFADTSCSGEGRRYGSASGAKSNLCVEGLTSDAGGSDAKLVADASDRLDQDPDAGIADASSQDAIDASTCEVKLIVSIFDGPSALNRVRVLVNGLLEGDCQATPSGGLANTSEECLFCVPADASIDLLAISESELQNFFNGCPGAVCGASTCSLTAMSDCSMTAVFTSQFPIE